jgi:hypothetical protein
MIPVYWYIAKAIRKNNLKNTALNSAKEDYFQGET